jgi:hypothetical protein
VGKVVFYWDNLDIIQVKAKALQAALDAPTVTPKTAVAIKKDIQSAVWRIPITLGVMPTGWAGKANGGKRDGNRMHLIGAYSGEIQTEFGRMKGHLALGVFVPDEAFFLGGGDQFAVYIESG